MLTLEWKLGIEITKTDAEEQLKIQLTDDDLIIIKETLVRLESFVMSGLTVSVDTKALISIGKIKVVLKLA